MKFTCHRSTSARRRTPFLKLGTEKLESRSLPACLVMAEFLASNQAGLTDEDGDRPDWIEVANDCATPQSLAGWHLTDDADRPRKWAFPNAELQPEERIVIFASGKNRRATPSNWHTNFKLNRDGEYLALTHRADNVGTVFSEYPPQFVDTSYGFPTDVEGTHTTTAGYFQTVTPGLANPRVTFADRVHRPQFSVGGGVYDVPQSLTLSTSTPGASIVYTTDGSPPAWGNGVVTHPPEVGGLATVQLELASTQVIRATALRDGWLPAGVQTESYIFPHDVAGQTDLRATSHGMPSHFSDTPADYEMDPDIVGPDNKFDCLFASQLPRALTSLPTVSLVFAVEEIFGSQGIYANSRQRGRDWERAVSFELMTMDQQLDIDGMVGLRIHGESSRDNNLTTKKSFRLTFRGEYGTSRLDAPLFDSGTVESFDQLILRAGFNDSWQDIDAENRAQFIRDQWYRETQSAMGHLSARGTFVHLYLNGLYWGLYNLTEFPSAEFATNHLGGSPGDWATVNADKAMAGDMEAWNEFLELAAEVATDDSQQSDDAYLRLTGADDSQRWLNVDNYIDYLIMNFYGATDDWPTNNWHIARRQGVEGQGFLTFSWDAEFSLGYGSNVNTNRLNAQGGIAEPFQLMRDNRLFREAFANRAQRHFSEGGALYVNPNFPDWDPNHPEWNVPAARYQRLAEQIELAVTAESARWGDQHRHDRPYTPDDWSEQRDQLLRDYFPRRSAIVIQQLVEAGLMQPIDAIAVDVLAAHLDNADADPRLPGDANCDGQFNFEDLLQVFQRGHFGNPAGDALWSDGDWDDNGVVDSDDLLLALSAGHYS